MKSGKGITMLQHKVIDFTQYRTKDDKPTVRKRKRKRIKGSVYRRHGKLWVDFSYLGVRIREPSGLADTEFNRKAVRKQLNLIMADETAVVFEPKDELSIMRSLQRLLDKREFARQIAANAQRHLKENYSAGDMISATIRAYRKAQG